MKEKIRFTAEIFLYLLFLRFILIMIFYILRSPFRTLPHQVVVASYYLIALLIHFFIGVTIGKKMGKEFLSSCMVVLGGYFVIAMLFSQIWPVYIFEYIISFFVLSLVTVLSAWRMSRK